MGVPKKRWLTVESPNLKWMMIRGTTVFWKPPFVHVGSIFPAINLHSEPEFPSNSPSGGDGPLGKAHLEATLECEGPGMG